MATRAVHPGFATIDPDVAFVEEKNRSDWDRFMKESPGVIAWHSYEFATILKHHYAADFYPLAVYSGSAICGILPLYRIRTLRGEALVSVPHFVAGGIAAAVPDVQQLLLNQAIDISKKLNISRITFKQYKLKLSGQLKTDENYYNRELTLSPDIGRIWESISIENRAKVDEARRVGATLDYPSPDLSSFYRLLLHDQHAAGVPCASQAWVKTLFQTGMYEVALLKRNGLPVAGTMVKKFRDTVSFPFTCLCGQDDKSFLLAYLLYWMLIETLAKQGTRIFHSGRIPNTDETFSYRLGWGGTKYNYYYQYYGLGDGKTEFSNKRGGKRQMFESLWRKLPTPVARVLGPVVVKQFP